jgi:hypothetical protein
MTAALGIWRQRTTAGRVLYRWETDTKAQGFLLFVPETRTFRPADEAGQPLGDYVVDAASGEEAGHAEGLDRTVFLQAMASILRAYARTGEAPATAHATYY